MALSPLDKKLLEFMYFLATDQEFMNSVKISKKLSKKGKKVSDRTVRRWFNYLQKSCFDYFPYPKYKNLGLMPITMIVCNLKVDKVLNIIPYMMYIQKGIGFKSSKMCKDYFLLMYLIPPDKISDFKKFWDFVCSKGLAEYYDLMEFRTPIDYYSPLHKILKQDGTLDFSTEYAPNNTQFINKLKENLDCSHEIKIHKGINKNPMIIPIILEYFREFWSSNKVWHSIKGKLKNSTWEYIKDIKKRKKKTDGVGIRHVQESLAYLQENFNDFFQQIRVVYEPLYSGKNNTLFLSLKHKNKESIIKLSKILSENSLLLTVYPPINIKDTTTLFYIVTDNKKVVKILNDILPFIADSKRNITIFRDYERSSKYWNRLNLKIDYKNLFDPVTLSWKYASNEYQKELSKLLKR